MALTFNGTKNSLNENQLPSGYSRPVVSEIVGAEYTQKKTYSILKSTVENATKSTTMTNIFANATIGLNKQIQDEIGLEFDDTANTIQAHAELIALTNNHASLSGSGEWLGSSPATYIATVNIYVRIV